MKISFKPMRMEIVRHGHVVMNLPLSHILVHSVRLLHDEADIIVNMFL
jgi:hypothetical protein